MAWEVEYTDEFLEWWQTLSEDEQADVAGGVEQLQRRGPQLGRPYVDHVKGSRHANMKELRTQSDGKPLRTFFALNPLRRAILLIGGDKTGDKRFYERMVPDADEIYDVHLRELEDEGLI